ncbi:MAG: hypothetical protein AAF654_07115 [Myxococcota bacterium]
MDVSQISRPPVGQVVEELEELLASESVQALVRFAPPTTDRLDRSLRAELDRCHESARADHGGKRIDSFVEAMKAAKVQGKRLPAEEVNEQILQMAAAGYSDEAQEEFTRYLRRRLAIKDGEVVTRKEGVELSDVLKRLRPALPGKNKSLDILQRFFGEQGFRLRGFDPEPDGSVCRQVDRAAVRQSLKPLRDGAKPMSKRDVREFLAHFSDTADEADIAWGMWQVDGRIRTGSVSFESREARELFYGFFDDRLEGKTTHQNATLLRARELRFRIEAGESPDRIAEATTEYLSDAAELRGDPDALFFARRVLEREMRKVEAPNRERLVGVVLSTTQEFFQPRLDGMLDRYSERHRIRRAVERGEMSEVDSWRLLAAVSVSETVAQYRVAQATLNLQVQAIIFEAMSAMIEAFNRNMGSSGDITDSDGNVIISALELYLERLEKERLIMERVVDAHELDAIGARLQIDSQMIDAVVDYGAARTPAEKSDAAGAIARLLSMRSSLEPVIRS